MQQLRCVDLSSVMLGIDRNLNIESTPLRRGPHKRLDGMMVGIADMSCDPPHKGERHPDGDELIFVVSGRITFTLLSEPAETLDLGPGEACIVPRGQWHTVHVVEHVKLLYMTPGPQFEYRSA